ncbi:Copper-binding lipoprotein NosL [Hyphomicrobium sp. 1Nfss2.1]|uniref:nitrous oxide reductase accessory protein NosL n=1 Tax=Hyphomicrobium sp. 1Nfss2.1 TaxID=3413936 RepID=UPI003C7A55EC
MKTFALIGVALGTIALAACTEEAPKAPPVPRALSAEAVGHYCGMNLLEHKGPKGQIILGSSSEPMWFSSARDAFSFTMLPDEAKDIRAIYVSDMAKAPSWDSPGPTNWVDARKAFFVIGSSRQGGMGAPETIPFSDRVAAEKFAVEYGGRVVTFEEVPKDYVLGSEPGAGGAEPHVGHGGPAGSPSP